MKTFILKMKGGVKSPPRAALSEILWSWIGAFLGIGALGLILYRAFGDRDLLLMLGSFGASAVLVYGSMMSPLAQPRNLIGGHLVSAVIGVAIYRLLPGNLTVAAPLAVSTAIAVMHLTRTLHPPGGATALIAVVGSSKIHGLGFLYVVWPVGLGAFILLVVALLVNNGSKHRKYPEFWY
jgi:CBS-domain-containing membrane protein